MEKFKQIVSWIFCVVFFILFIGTITNGIAWIFFLGLTLLLCPPMIGLLEKVHKKPKLGIRMGLGIALLFLGLAFFPQTDSDSIVANNAAENTQDIINTNEIQGDTSNSEIDANSDKSQEPQETVDDKVTETQSEPTTTPSPILSKDAIKSGEESDNIEDTDTSTIIPKKELSTETNKLNVHFIDVGQGDSILIESDGQYMLIDAGENNKGTTVVNYLKDQGVTKLDYIIGTHPHSDHIGGLDTVISSFTIGKVIMPDVVHTTKTFEDVLDAIADKNLKITKAVAGNKYTLGSATFTIIAPNGSSYNNLNDYSVAIKLSNGNNSFLFAGDAETLSEKEMLKNGINLSADVMKLSHHGSETSSHSSFIDKINPSYAVISVGSNNQYNHPHAYTLQDMVNRNIKVFRTDMQGTILFTSDGENLTVNTNAYKITSADLLAVTQEEQKEPSAKDKTPIFSENNILKTIVHITETGSKYHVAGCRYLKSDIEITLEKALEKGLEPCKTCKPPTK